MSNETYDCLKYLCQVLIPALGTLIFSLSEIWHFPYASQIVGTLTAVDAFLGVALKISSDNFYQGKH